MLLTWNIDPLVVAVFAVVYLSMEGAFLSATLVKIPSGGESNRRADCCTLGSFCVCLVQQRPMWLIYL